MWPPPARRSDIVGIPRGSERVTRGAITVVRGPGRTCVGYAVARSVGNAVTRNRVRRRIKEAVRLGVDVDHVQGTCLIIGRRPAVDADFADIEDWVRSGFQELHERTRSADVRPRGHDT